MCGDLLSHSLSPRPLPDASVAHLPLPSPPQLQLLLLERVLLQQPLMLLPMLLPVLLLALQLHLQCAQAKGVKP